MVSNQGREARPVIEIESMGWVLSFDPSAVLAPGMFLALIVALLSGFPVAFCLGGIGVIFALLGMLTAKSKLNS